MEKVCEICGGSGQIGQFLGVSRFVITWEECPECHGTGTSQSPEKQAAADEKPSPSGSAKNTKGKTTSSK